MYPDRVKNLLSNLDLNHNEMTEVKKLWVQNHISAACQYLVQYFQEKKAKDPSQKFINPDYNLNLPLANSIQDIFTFQSLTAKVPRDSDGQLDWNNKGPKNDREWTWFLNRHYHFLDWLNAYSTTKNTIYIYQLNHQISDWITSCPSPENQQIWGQWRGLEVTFRIIHWAQIFYNLQQVKEFSPATRILMLSSILDHAYYLRYLSSWGANWLIKEMCGLSTIALCWPEFKDSQRWLRYATNRLINELPEQIYPDGVHKELTSHYHKAVLLDLQNLADLLTQSGQNIPEDLTIHLERMWSYLAYSMRPDGHGLLNNDSDRTNNRSLINQAAKIYQRPDWHYIATNGKLGQQPKGSPSRTFPWAGQVIMRSGWDTQAQWSFFDIGPLGIYYHIHNDKLHLSVSAYGRDLLVDSGRYSYIRNKFWSYFRGSSSHNVILVDGQGQKSDARESFQPIESYTTQSEFDFAKGTFDRGFTSLAGKATHTRALLYLRNKYWVVVDQITTDRPRKIEPLWHFHPDCDVIIEDDTVTSINPNEGNLRIIPCSHLSWTLKLVQGQEDPVQGWWSSQYNQKIPNPTAIYSTYIQQTTTFAWILLPALGLVPKPEVHLLPSPKDVILLRIKTPDKTQDLVSVRVSGDTIIDLGSDFDNLKVDADCAIFCTHQQPKLFNGVIKDARSSVIYEHRLSAK